MIAKAKLTFCVLMLLCGFSTISIAQDEEQRIVFARGRSTAVIKDRWQEAIIDYRLHARAGQIMRIKLVSPKSDVHFRIVRPSLVGGGSPTPFVNEKGNFESKGSYFWNGKLPETGDYLIELFGPGENAPYTLTVTIK